MIASRVLRTWGTSESALAEALDDRLGDLETTDATIAFLASGIEGLKVRVTVRAPNDVEAIARLDEEESVVRRVLLERLGDVVFGVDDETMEHAVASRLVARRSRSPSPNRSPVASSRRGSSTFRVRAIGSGAAS